MKLTLLLVHIATAVALQAQVEGKLTGDAGYKKKVVCYFGSWSVYRPGAGKFDVEDIDPYVCTHLIYGFAGLQSSSNMIVALDPYNDLEDNYGKGAYKRFTKLKEINPLLKTLLAVGGWNEGSEKYSKMVSSAESRSTFVKSVVEFLLKYGFDGLDFDWEYPTFRGGAAGDRENFIKVLRELRSAFDPHGLLLTSALSAGKDKIDAGYDVPAIAENLDWLNVMTYDFHGYWDSQHYTGHHEPMYRRPDEIDGNATLNANYSINYWIGLGAPREKIVMGIGLYGRGFVLKDPANHGVYAPASQPIPAGPYTREAGTWGFNEICDQLKKPDWTVVRDEYYRAPYAYRGRNWIGYDDVESVEIKAKFILKHGLAGGMAWSIDTDDFSGECSGQEFALLTKLHETMNGPIIHPTLPPTTTIVPPSGETTTGRPVVPTGPTPKPDDICKHEGLNPDPENCQVFYSCEPDGQGGWEVEKYKCGDGTVFDPVKEVCDWPEDVPGCDGVSETRVMV